MVNYKDYKGFLGIKGYNELMDKRICFQASDDYFNCIEEQNLPLEKVNKFKCIDEQYNMNKYCTNSFIAQRKQVFTHNFQAKNNFSQEELDYLNFRANNLSMMSVKDHELLNSLSISKL